MTDPRVIVARSNKRISIATSKSVFGPWTRRDAPILTPRPGSLRQFLLLQPGSCLEEDGVCGL